MAPPRKPGGRSDVRRCRRTSGRWRNPPEMCRPDREIPRRTGIPPEIRAMLASMSTIEFTLNGERRRVETAPGESLLDTLRERCGIISTKDGCQPQGQCGCCLALVDGQAEDDLRDHGGQGPGQGDPDAGGRAGSGARADREGVRVGGGAAVRLLYPGHRAARAAPAGQEPGPLARRDRQSARRSPVPLHRLREDRGRGRADGEGAARRAASRSRRRTRRVGKSYRRYRATEMTLGDAAVRGRHDAREHAPRRAALVRARAGAGVEASTRRRRRRCPAWRRSSRRRTCRASAGTACSTTTGPASSP